MQTQPFRRAQALALAIAGILAATANNPMARQAQMAELPPYISRGKGQNSPNKRAPGAGMASVRAARKARNVRRHRKASRG